MNLSLEKDLLIVRALIARHEPCRHETSNFNVGDGSTWAICEDCGERYDRERFEATKGVSIKRFEEAYAALERIRVAINSSQSTSHLKPLAGHLLAISDLLNLAVPELEKIRNV